MCTLAVAFGIWESEPLLVAANRDERLDRSARAPSLLETEPRRIWAPQDLEGSGTWLGVNDAGLFVGITNRFGQRPLPGRRSRGLLVRELLRCGDAAEAASQAENIGVDDTAPFHLLIADRDRAERVHHDGTQIQRTRLLRGFHVITERSLGAGDSRRPDTVRDALQGLDRSAPPADDVLQQLLSRHDPDPFEGVCVHVPAWNYGTRSSCLLRLGTRPDQLRFLYADGTPCTAPWQDLSESARLALSWTPSG